MSKIYSQAKTVIAWLGEEDDNSDAAIDLLNWYDLKQNDGSILQRLNDIQYTEQWEALGKLLDQSYWQRSWIIQELLLPSEGSVILLC